MKGLEGSMDSHGHMPHEKNHSTSAPHDSKRKRPRGRPRLRYMDTIRRDMRVHMEWWRRMFMIRGSGTERSHRAIQQVEDNKAC